MAFLRVKLHADAVTSSYSGNERSAVIGRRQHITAFKRIAVEEISFARFDQRMELYGCHIIPAHVRDFDARISRSHRPHPPFDPAKPQMDAVFLTRLSHQLHAHANSKEGLGSSPSRLIQRINHPLDPRQRVPAMRKRPDPWQNNPVCAAQRVWISGDADIIRSRRFERVPNRLKIARAVIDQRNSAAHRLNK